MEAWRRRENPGLSFLRSAAARTDPDETPQPPAASKKEADRSVRSAEAPEAEPVGEWGRSHSKPHRAVNDTSLPPEERPCATAGESDASTGVAPATAGVRVSGARKAVHRMMWAVMGMFGPMLTCRELTDFLARYVDGALTPEEQKAFERHLAMCRPCRAFVESYRKTIDLERTAFAEPDAPVPDEVPEELVRAILAARRAAG